MCQSKEKGGRRCPSHQPGYLGLKTLAKNLYGLDDNQIKHTYDALRLQGRDRPAPTMDEYEAFISKQEDVLSSPSLDSGMRRRAKRQFRKEVTELQLPDGATFYAMENLMRGSENQRRRITTALKRFSRSRGMSYSDAESKFKEILETSVSPIRPQRRGILEARTRSALEQLYRGNTIDREETRRVRLTPVAAEPINAAGYDPEDGRLEIEIDGRIHAFRDVSQEEWNSFQKTPVRAINKVRTDPDKQYLSQREAESDAYRIWCNDCKRYRLASGHRCPPNGEEKVYLDFKESLRASDPRPLRTPEWYKVWEKRRHLDMGQNPSPHDVRRIAEDFAIAEFTLSNTTPDGHVVLSEFSAGKATPRDITLEMKNPPRCDCDVYQRNSECEHTRDGSFKRSAQRFYDEIDEGSSSRNRDMTFPYQAYSPSGRIAFSCPPDGMDAEMVNDIAYLCSKDRRAMLYLNNKETEGNGEALGAFIFQKSGNDIETLIQATCSLCESTDCEHLASLAKRYSEKIQERLLNPSYRLKELGHMDAERDELLRAHASYVNRFSERRTPRYSDNIEMYIDDLREAEKMVRSGDSPLKLRVEPVTNGNISSVPGEGRGFGVELEYVVDNERQRYAIQEEVANSLFSAGLSRGNTPFDYGASSHETGYHEWAVEDDASVSGEVISPIMYDTPESWDQIAKVCEIIKKHGGRVDENCGQHVHIGTIGTSTRASMGIMEFVQANQDSLRRAGTNPERGTHRNNTYSVPVGDGDAQALVYELKNNDHSPLSRARIVNFQNSGHVEFRDADGTLDPAHIQAQVMISSAIVAKAEEDKEAGQRPVPVQEIGSNRKRTQLVTGGRMRNLSDDEIMVSDIAYRSTIDALFDDEKSKKTMVALAALNPWQKGH